VKSLGHGPLVAALLYCVAVAFVLSDSRPVLPPVITHSMSLRQMAFLSRLIPPPPADSDDTGDTSPIEVGLSDPLEELARKPLATDRDRLLGAGVAIYLHAPHLVPLFLAPLAATDPLAATLIDQAFDPTAPVPTTAIDLAADAPIPSHLRDALVATLAQRAGREDLVAAVRDTTLSSWEQTLWLGSLAAVLLLALLVAGTILWFRSGRWTMLTAPAERPAWAGLLPTLRVLVFFAAVYLTVGALSPWVLDSLGAALSLPVLAILTYLLTGTTGLVLLGTVGRSAPHERFMDLSGLSTIRVTHGWGRTLAWVPGGYAMLLPMVMAASVFSTAFTGDGDGTFDNPMALYLVTDPDPWTTVLLLLSVSILAPLFEEPLFRGFVHSRLRRYFSINGAAMLSGLVFGVAHFSPGNIIPLAAIGFTLALIYERTGNLLAPMLVHGAWNLGTAIALLVMFSG